MIVALGTPCAIAASTNGRRRSRRTSPYTIRAVHAQYSAVTTTTIPSTPWPSTLASARPEMTVGTDRKISVIRISSCSTTPR